MCLWGSKDQLAIKRVQRVLWEEVPLLHSWLCLDEWVPTVMLFWRRESEMGHPVFRFNVAELDTEEHFIYVRGCHPAVIVCLTENKGITVSWSVVRKGLMWAWFLLLILKLLFYTRAVPCHIIISTILQYGDLFMHMHTLARRLRPSLTTRQTWLKVRAAHCVMQNRLNFIQCTSLDVTTTRPRQDLRSQGVSKERFSAICCFFNIPNSPCIKKLQLTVHG